MDVLILLPPELVGLIVAKVASGRYRSAGEVVREALRLPECADQRYAEDLTRLCQAWAESAASADAGPLDFAALKMKARSHLRGPSKG